MATETEALVPTGTTPNKLLEIAVSQNADIEKLSKLLELQGRWQAMEAKHAFDDAKAKFSSFAIQVTRDKVNAQFQSKYTTLGNLVNTVTPYLAKCDLNVRWELDQSNGIKVTCILSHIGGHSEHVSLTVPPDDSGKKNVIQQIKSAITYAKGCTFESVCGLASTDANVDDDGNGAAHIDAGRVAEHCEWLASAKDLDELKKLFRNAYTEAELAKDRGAMQAYISAKDKRKKELQ